MPRTDEITQILDARFEGGALPLVVMTVRHGASNEEWLVPIKVDAAADMVKRVSALLAEQGLL